MRDADVRPVLLEHLAELHRSDRDTMIVQELGVEHGATRVDVAVVNGSLDGYEIKSDEDTLERLPDQVRAFSAVFERVTLVVGSKHLDRALCITPKWWGVIVARVGSEGGVTLVTRRKPRRNRGADRVAVAELLWKNETLAALENVGAAKGYRSKSREVLSERLASLLSEDHLFDLVRRQLRSRVGWRTSPREPATRT